MAKMSLYTGVVENRNDPLKLGRVKVRVHGVHNTDIAILPTEDLPWAIVIQPERIVSILYNTCIKTHFSHFKHSPAVLLGQLAYCL
jgi:hypothetical protein